jgi:hypothetical protein
MRVSLAKGEGPMNLNDNPTIEQFRDLLRQHDDHAGHHVLWVRKDGEVMLTCLPNEKPYRVPTYEHPQMQMRFDTFQIGYGHVGPEAADQSWFMGEVFKHMLDQWARLKGAAGILHLDLDSVAPDGRPVDAKEAAELRRLKEEYEGRKQAGQLDYCPGSGQSRRGEVGRDDAAVAGGRRGRMNLNDNPTMAQFNDLLQQHDDRAGHHVLWVRRDGEVMLTCLPKDKPYKVSTYEHPQMQMRYDTFPASYGYVGPRHPDDDGWFMGELFKHMLAQWARLQGAAEMAHLDLDSVAPDGRPVDAEELAELRRIREEIAREKQSRQSHCCPGSNEQETALAHRRNV